MRLDDVFHGIVIQNASTPKAGIINEELRILQAMLEEHVAKGLEKIDIPTSRVDFLNELEGAERERLRKYRAPLADAANFIGGLGERLEDAAGEAEEIAADAGEWLDAGLVAIDNTLRKIGCRPCAINIPIEEFTLTREKAERAKDTASKVRIVARRLPKTAAEFASAMNRLMENPNAGRPAFATNENNFVSNRFAR